MENLFGDVASSSDRGFVSECCIREYNCELLTGKLSISGLCRSFVDCESLLVGEKFIGGLAAIRVPPTIESILKPIFGFEFEVGIVNKDVGTNGIIL